MAVSSKKSLKNKLLFLIIIPIILLSVSGIIVSSIQISKSGKKGIEEKSTAILSRMEAVRNFVAEQNFLDVEIERLKNKSEISIADKENILNLVPIIASWKVGEKNAESENYEFRIASENSRNSKNQASELELKFLQRFETENIKELTYIDRTTNSFWVMRPIFLSEKEGCLKCHGDPQTSIFNDGKDIVGYEMEGWDDGDIRGMFMIKSDLKPVQNEITKAISTIGIITIIIGFLVIIISFIIIKKITDTFQQIKNATQKISEGDLRQTIEIKTNDDLGEISEYTNNMIISLNGMLTNISKSVENLDSASKEISQSSETISQGAQEQAAHFEELSSSVQNTSDSSFLANEITAKTAKNANYAGKSMENVLNSMLNIEKKSKNINEAINLISEIAFKTNLLSINAGIEAARAGEYGTGFAVVAEEVRRLAELSSNSAKEIEEIIKISNKEIKTGVDITKNASIQITDVIENINKIAIELDKISSASKEQSLSMEQTTSVIAMNASSSEQLAAAAQSLANEAQTLSEMINDFKFNEH